MPLTRLVLASTSRYRRELLARLEVPFEVAAPRFDEDATRDRFDALDDEAYAVEVARGKACSLTAAFPSAWVLGADQVAVLPGPPRRLLVKPRHEADAVEQLLSLAGTTHRLVTAVVLREHGSAREHAAVDVHRLTMRAFDRPEAEAYVRRHRPLDCVGAYRIEDAGIKLLSRVQGEDHTAIVGLPLIAVAGLLRAVGLLSP